MNRMTHLNDRSQKKASLRKSAVMLIGSKVVTYTISLVTTMMLSRILTLDEYGTFSQILIVNNLLVSIFMLGLPFSLNDFLAKAGTEEEKSDSSLNITRSTPCSASL